MEARTISNLRKLRTERFLTQAQLAETLGISKRTLIRWEDGQGEPGASELMALARFYGISIDQLVGDLFPPEPTGAFLAVRHLSGDQLNYWVAKVRGLPVEMTDAGPVLYEPGVGQRPVPAYCADWAHAGPIIDLKNIQFDQNRAGEMFDGQPLLADSWVGRCADCSLAALGSTKLEAAMRAYLTAEVGPQILA
jgi:transcriptional regulator with XRE-family HTH domain